MTPAQKAQIASVTDGPTMRLGLRVLGASTVYVEFGADATVAKGWPLEQGDPLTYEDRSLDAINLIADGADNTDIRIIAT